MTRWQTTTPPMDREIEVETHSGKTNRGVLAGFGQFSMVARPRDIDANYRDQFTMRDNPVEMFEVRRWREIE